MTNASLEHSTHTHFAFYQLYFKGNGRARTQIKLVDISILLRFCLPMIKPIHNNIILIHTYIYFKYWTNTIDDVYNTHWIHVTEHCGRLMMLPMGKCDNESTEINTCEIHLIFCKLKKKNKKETATESTEFINCIYMYRYLFIMCASIYWFDRMSITNLAIVYHIMYRGRYDIVNCFKIILSIHFFALIPIIFEI